MSVSSTANISPVHGGLDQPVNRLVEGVDAEWSKLAVIDVNEIDRTTLYRIADGTLSPLNGPMTESDYKNVLRKAAIERNGKWWAWGIPTILPVTGDEAEKCKIGDTLALAIDGEIFGTIKVRSVYEWDKANFIQSCYGTDRTDHPGAGLWLGDDRTMLVGGEISLAPFKDEREFADRVLSPLETRKLIEDKGWEQSIGFQTRNPLHRAHEYALVYGAEMILRENGRKTGVILNPLVGQLKGDDVPAATRMKTYVTLVEEHFLGQGDKDEELWKEKGQDFDEAVTLIGLDMRMYYGGPREAIMHAIYRQNLRLHALHHRPQARGRSLRRRHRHLG